MHLALHHRNSRDHMEELLALIPRFIARLGWSRAEIEDHQRRELRSLLAHAASRSRWHRARLAGIDIDSFEVERLADIPPMTKADLIEHWDDIVAVEGASFEGVRAHFAGPDPDGYIFGDCKAVASGGTSGQTAYFLYSWDAWPAHLAGMNRSYFPILARFGDPRQLIAATISAEGSAHITHSLSKTFSQESNTYHRIPISAPHEVIVARLNALKPDFLHLYPSLIPFLEKATAEGRLTHRPRIVLSTSEPLLEEHRRFVQGVWGAILLDVWTMTETSGSFACPDGVGFHISEDLNIVEPGDTGDATPHVLVTNLYNRALPLIRYRIEDELDYGEGCGCGSQYRHVGRVVGRIDDYFHYRQATVHSMAIETPLLEVPGVLGYQVFQTEDGARIDMLCPPGTDLAAAERAVAVSLAAAGLPGARISARRVEALPRTSGGKLKKFVPIPEARS